MDVFIENIKKYMERLTGNKKRLGKTLLIVFILILAAVLKLNGNDASKVSVETDTEIKSETESVEMYVDISGEVNAPGVYQVTSDTRLFEVIEKAGGLTERADHNSINQADFIEDGQKIIIPSVNEVSPETDNNTQTSVISDDGLININSAGKDDLMKLNGVGEKIAERIIEYREKNRFNQIEDIMNVKGIGESTFEKLKTQIKV